ncbi:MAG: hypothetical protein OXD33_12150 [Rhodobacteraceae bacterium]|nr:hypothetical protein [Paracoccaceae bacterium]
MNRRYSHAIGQSSGIVRGLPTFSQGLILLFRGGCFVRSSVLFLGLHVA